MTPPHLSLRQAAAVFESFLEDGLSATSVSRARDAFAHVIMQLNRSHITGLMKSEGNSTLFLAHIHDEASLRVRSYTPEPAAAGGGGGQRLARGRSSKVQLNVVHVAGNTWEDCVHIGCARTCLSCNLLNPNPRHPLQTTDAMHQCLHICLVSLLALLGAQTNRSETPAIGTCDP